MSTTVTSTRTHFSDFKRQHAKDARFREFGKTEGEREKEFKKWLRELGERKRAEAERAEKEFREMLQADGQIRSGDKWTEVRSTRAAVEVPRVTLPSQVFADHLALYLTAYRSRSDTRLTHATPPSTRPRSANNSLKNTSPRSLRRQRRVLTLTLPVPLP